MVQPCPYLVVGYEAGMQALGELMWFITPILIALYICRRKTQSRSR